MALEAHVEKISSELAPIEALRIFSTVQDILKRIVDNPSEPKFRAPTKQKVESKLGTQGMDLLRSLGFIDNGDKFVLPETVGAEQLTEAQATIECLATSLSGADESLDPETAEAIRLSMEDSEAPAKRQRADENADRALAEELERSESTAEVAFERFREEDVIVDIAMVEEINGFCRASGDKYVDPQFPPSNKSIYLDEVDATTWTCLMSGCKGRTTLPPVPPLPKSREEAINMEEDFERLCKCSACGRTAHHAVKVQYFNRPLQWLRPGEHCVGCEMVWGHLQSGKELISRMCPHFIRDEMSETTVGIPWKVIRSEARAEDVCQGALGNCWFAGALSVVARVPELIENLFLTKEFNPNGAYMLRLFHAGAWKNILIDDLLPTSQIFEGYADGNQVYYSRGGTLTYLHGARRQLWVPFVEKAAAKLFRCYQGMKGGTFGEALALFTGCPVERLQLYIRKEVEQARQQRRQRRADARTQLLLQGRDPSEIPSDSEDELGNDDLTWSKLMSANEQGYLMGLGCTEEGVEKTKDEILARGLQAPHAYGILDVREVQINGQITRLVKIRNPWGEKAPKTWLGDWGKDSSKWTYNLKLALGKINKSNITMEDEMSIFWMEFHDMKKYFAAVEICRLHFGWKEISAKGWLPSGVGAGECFELTVYRRTQVDVTLWQEKHIQRMGAGVKSTNIDIGLAVMRRRGTGGNNTSGGMPEYEFVEYFRRTPEDHAGGELILDGGYVYRVVPISFGFMQEYEPRRSTLVVHSVQKVDLKTVRMAWEDLSHAIGESCRRRGRRQPQAQNPYLTTWLLQEPTGFVHYIENSSTSAAAMQVDCSDSIGCIVTRGSPLVMNCIPPQSRQVVLALAMQPGASRFSPSIGWDILPLDFAAGAAPNEDLHAPLPLVSQEWRSSGIAPPDESILQAAPPEEPAPRNPLGGARPTTAVSVSAPAPAPPADVDMGDEDEDMLAEALRMSMEGQSKTSAPLAADGEDADPEAELAEAIRLSMIQPERNGHASSTAETAKAGESAKASGPSNKAKLQEEVKRLYIEYTTQLKMDPQEAASKALKDAMKSV